MYFYRLPETIRLAKKEKVIPHYASGVVGFPPTSPVMKSVLEWLKTERLHKYWPVFSRMTYQMITGLDEHNIDVTLAHVNATQMTSGARARLLRRTKWLRARSNEIQAVDEKTSLYEICRIFRDVLVAPMSAADEPDGISLVVQIHQKLLQIIIFHGMRIISVPEFAKVLHLYEKHAVIPEPAKELIKTTVKNICILSNLETPPPSPPLKNIIPSPAVCTKTARTPSPVLPTVLSSCQPAQPPCACPIVHRTQQIPAPTSADTTGICQLYTVRPMGWFEPAHTPFPDRSQLIGFHSL